MKECQDFQNLNHSLHILDIQSFKHVLEREEENFIKQHYTSLECSVTDTGERWIQYLAGRWAAKSAIIKCLAKSKSEIAYLLGKDDDQSGFWLNIEILRLPTGQPLVKLFGQCQQIAIRLSVKRWLLSISHTASYAVASVIALV